MKNAQSSLKRILYIANFLLITFVLKQVISGIPNVQVVVLLMAVFANKSKVIEISTFMLAYVILDFLVGGYPTLMIPSFIFGFVGMLFIQKTNYSDIAIAIFTLPLTIFHMLIYMFHDILFLGMPLESVPAYLLAGFPFAVPMFLSSFFSILWLFKPLNKILGIIIKE